MSTEMTRETLERRLDSLEARVDDLEAETARRDDRLDELDAGQQAVRGFLGGVDAVNEAVERRADAALAAVERLEATEATTRGVGTDADGNIDDDVVNVDANNDVVSTDANSDARTVDGDDTDSAEATGAPSASLRDRLRNLR